MSIVALSELLGATVRDATGTVRGRVREVAIAPQDHPTRVAYLIVNTPDGERLLPAAALKSCGATVRTDDDTGVLGDGLAALAVAAYARDSAVVDDEVFDRELLAYLGAGLGGGVDEQLVEHGPPWAVRNRRIGGPGRAGDRKGPKSNAYVSIGGHPVAVSRSIKPQRFSA